MNFLFKLIRFFSAKFDFTPPPPPLSNSCLLAPHTLSSEEASFARAERNKGVSGTRGSKGDKSGDERNNEQRKKGGGRGEGGGE